MHLTKADMGNASNQHKSLTKGIQDLLLEGKVFYLSKCC